MTTVNFKNWFFLNESFNLNYSVLDELFNWLIKQFAEIRKNPNANIKGKQFLLNLRETKFKYLYEINPEINYAIYINFLNTELSEKKNFYAIVSNVEMLGSSNQPKWLSNDLVYSDESIPTDENENYWICGITFNRKIPNSEIYNTLEHEVLHSIQEFTNIHTKQKTEKKIRSIPEFEGVDFENTGLYSEGDFDRVLNYAKNKDNQLPNMETPLGKYIFRVWHNALSFYNLGDRESKKFMNELKKYKPEWIEELDRVAEIAKRKLNKNNINIFSQELHKGGLPPRSITAPHMKLYGIDPSGKYKNQEVKSDKINHEKIPVEFYTNLASVVHTIKSFYILTVIRKLHPEYKDSIAKYIYGEGGEEVGNIPLKKIVKSKEFKSYMINDEFKKEVLNDVLKNTKYLDRFKFNKRLYNKYLSEIYKRFLLDVDFAEELAPILEKQQKLSNYEKLD